MKSFLNNLVSVIVAIVLTLTVINFDPTVRIPVVTFYEKINEPQLIDNQSMLEELSKNGIDPDSLIYSQVELDVDEEMGYCSTKSAILALPKENTRELYPLIFHFGKLSFERGPVELRIKNEGGYLIYQSAVSDGLTPEDEYGLSECIGKRYVTSVYSR